MASFLFNSCFPLSSIKNIQHLYLISSHPSFARKVNQFVELLSPRLNMESLIHLGALFFAVILPDFPIAKQKSMARELVESTVAHQAVGYHEVLEVLIRICSYSLENIEVHSAIGWLELIKSRIVNTYVVNVVTDSRKKVNFHFQLEMFPSETVLAETHLPEKFHREEVKHIYFEEKLTFEEKDLEATSEQVVVMELKSNSLEVIPWGYVCENYIHELVNNNFATKPGYRLKHNKKLLMDKVDYWVEHNQSVANLIRDYTVNQEIFLTLGVLSVAHLPQVLAPSLTRSSSIFRLNQAYQCRNYLQKLKQADSSEGKYYNILSEYFQREEFNIDELSLTRDKLIVRRKESLLGIAGKESVKKHPKDYEQQVRLFASKVLQNFVKYNDDSRTFATSKNLQKALRYCLEEDSSLNSFVEKHLSRESEPKSDPEETFSSDLISLASLIPLQLLVLGKPKSGKSTIAREIAQQYGLVYLSVQTLVEKLFERLKFFDENPPEADEEGNPKEGLTMLEKYMLQGLSEGKQCEEEDILDLLNRELETDSVRAKGFILDLPFQYSHFWAKKIFCNSVALPKINCRFFTHVVVLDYSEAEGGYFAETLLEKPEDASISSAYDRYVLSLPKVPVEGEEENETEKMPLLLDANLIEVKRKKATGSMLDFMLQHLQPSEIIKVSRAYLNAKECLLRLKPHFHLIPQAKKIQGSEKELLSVGLQEKKIFRRWSPFGMVDCVELEKDKLLLGKAEFAAEYAGRVFVFENQSNLGKFLALPRKYVQKAPQLPKSYNICITGPRKSGKRTISHLLKEAYGWKVVHAEDLLEKVLQKQRKFETHIPSNFEHRSNSVHLSEGEYKDFGKGNGLPDKDILPILLFQLGVNLQKKPPNWAQEKTEEEGEAKEQEEKKVANKKPKKKEKNLEEERPKTPPPQDLALKDIIPEINHKGRLNELRGYIFVGFPNNEGQLNAMKAFNIPIDKMIILSDLTEEGPNKRLEQRLNDAELEQIATFHTSIAPVKEALTQEICKQVLIDKSLQDIVNKIRQMIDPFYLKVDEDSLNRVLADKQEDGDPIPLTVSGQYCPVNLKDGFLIKGKDQFQAGIKGKRFKCAGEKELAAIKENPQIYLRSEQKGVPPRILFMGIRGVGLRTQLLKLNELHRIPILSFKDVLLQQLENEKNKRKAERYYRRGFKKQEFDEEGKVVEDAELNDEGPDFDRRGKEIEVTRKIFEGIAQIFINGNFFQVEEEKVGTSLVELLSQARRLPEMVVMLTADEPSWLSRVLDKKAIAEELENAQRARRKAKEQERAEARQKALDAGQEYQDPPDEDDGNTQTLEELINQKSQSLRAQREADAAKMEEYSEAFKAWNVQVVTISCERDSKHISDKINYAIKPVLTDRVSSWERNNMQIIERHRVSDFLSNYIARESRFGSLNPFTLMENSVQHPLIYRDRIYYFSSPEEREYAMQHSKLLRQNLSSMSDVHIKPLVLISGLPKTGKTSLANSLASKLGLKKLQVKEIIQGFATTHFDKEINTILEDLRSGKTLSDQSLICLLEKRITLQDCSKGVVFDGVLSNKKQCELLSKRNLVPTLFISLKLSSLEIKKRVMKNGSKETYDNQLEVIDSRIASNRANLEECQIYYLNKHSNVLSIQASLSKWGILEKSLQAISERVKATRVFVRELASKGAADVSKVGVSFNCIMNNLSEFQNYCPISFKIRREYVRICLRCHEHLALFNHKFYAFKGQNELKDFISNPETFASPGLSFHPPREVEYETAFKSIDKLENKAYCIVQLYRDKLCKANALYMVSYKQKIFGLSSAQNLKNFLKNPMTYELAHLPDKLNVEFETKNDLKKIAKRNDCSAFLEHHLSNIMMRSLAQLGYRRPKYPTLGSKESALKFLAISLKANNPNKDDEYRQKYNERLQHFIKECNYSQEIREELGRKAGGNWDSHDEENLLKLCEEYNSFLKLLQTTDKPTYFSSFIR